MQTPPLSSHFLSASAFAIRTASSPLEALHLFKLRLLRRQPLSADPFETHAAVFALKSSSSSPLHLHSLLLKSNLLSSLHVAAALLHSYSLLSLPSARHLFDEIPHPNTVTSNTMLTCLSNHNLLSPARSLFDSMPHRDIASWSAMIAGYLSRGHRSVGLSLFREMMRTANLKPDQLMLVTLLSGCADVGSFRLLPQCIHCYVEKNGFEINAQLGTSLIDAYAKCGCLESAYRVFELMPKRNVAHWTAMICGLANHGLGGKAVALFEAMKEDGVRPNEITFTGVLNACCHAGLVEEGKEYFVSMVDQFGFEPGIHHYGCMVDLLAKAGNLEDAYRFIRNMKVEPNIVVWTSFLAACKKYKNFKIAEKAMERVLGMAIPEDKGGVYTLISDLYALGGKWSDVERVRKLMDRHNVRKNRGSSFIEVEQDRASAG